MFHELPPYIEIEVLFSSFHGFPVLKLTFLLLEVIISSFAVRSRASCVYFIHTISPDFVIFRM